MNKGLIIGIVILVVIAIAAGSLILLKKKTPKPVDCEVEWGDLEPKECTKTCGEEYQIRKQKIKIYPSNGGKECPELQEEKIRCNIPECPPNTDCVVDWGNWSDCSKTCGTGTRSRTQYIKTPASGIGIKCPSESELQTETEICNTQPCQPKIDCVVDWGSWTNCTKTCGEELQTRSQYIKVPPSGGGASCPILKTESRSCNLPTCPPSPPPPSFQTKDQCLAQNKYNYYQNGQCFTSKSGTVPLTDRTGYVICDTLSTETPTQGNYKITDFSNNLITYLTYFSACQSRQSEETKEDIGKI